MLESDRLISTQSIVSEEALDRAIRPLSLSEYVGQEAVSSQMQIFIDAAKKRNDALDHVLIFGPPGLGKTTLANIIAHEMGVNIRQTSGPVIERAGDIAAILTNLQHNDVLFIDEIHRLSPVIEEILYPAMEDYKLDIMIGEGPAARSIKLELPAFTLIGATTRAGSLTSPLRDRFGIVQRLEYYSTEALTQIVTRSAQLLWAVIERFNGGPVGVESIAAAIGEEKGTIEDVLEPFLIQQGFLMRTSRGRIATPRAYQHFDLKVLEQ